MELYFVNAFTDQPFKGNPAAVCLLTKPKKDAWMQKVAKELNLPVTAFVKTEPEGNKLRWFTPTTEIPICGHGTLASAHILWEKGYIDKDESVSFLTKSGKVTAKLKDGWIELNFPSAPDEEIVAPPDLIKAIGVEPKYVGKYKLDYIVEVESDEIVKNLTPNIKAMALLPVRGVIVTSRSSSTEFDFISRFFSPAQGIDEDFVTGSAHCCLGPYWKRKLNKDEFVAYQASARGGVIKVRVSDDRVLLSGQGVTVLQGDLMV
jgi:PhzF family phenazine biosynthesis protein